MIRQGYLVKVVDKSADEGEVITWHIGPRGKVEVDNEAIANIVRAVYGGSSDELEKKMQTSLGVKDYKAELEGGDAEMEDAPEGNANGANTSNGQQNGEDAQEEDEQEEALAEEQPARRRSTRRRQ